MRRLDRDLAGVARRQPDARRRHRFAEQPERPLGVLAALGEAAQAEIRPAEPRLITKWSTAGKGVHRYSFDGRYAYLSPTVEGYVGNIAMILPTLQAMKQGDDGCAIDRVVGIVPVPAIIMATYTVTVDPPPAGVQLQPPSK